LGQEQTGGLNTILDQQLALKWIQDHINEFGGDNTKVTLFGQSAGATSVCMHLAAEGSKGLFQNVIMESSACNGPWGPDPKEVGLQNSADWMSRNNLTLDDLRTIKASELIQIEPDAIHPSIDGLVLSKMTTEIFEAQGVNLPGKMLIGSNSLDGLMPPPFSLRPAPQDASAYESSLVEYGFSASEAQQISGEYEASSDAAHAFWESTAHLCVTCPAITLADMAQGKAHMYYFMYNGNALHGAEVPFVFGNEAAGWGFDKALSDQMMQYWLTLENLPVWSDSHEVLNIADTITQAPHPIYDKCQFWNTFDNQKRVNYCNGVKPNPTVLLV